MSSFFPPPGLAPPTAASAQPTTAPLTPPPSYELLLVLEDHYPNTRTSSPPIPPSLSPRLGRSARKAKPSLSFAPLNIVGAPLETVIEAEEANAEPCIADASGLGSEPSTPSSIASTSPSSSSGSESEPATPASATFPGASLTTRVDTLEINFELLMRRVDGLRLKLSGIQLDVGGMEDALDGLEREKRLRWGRAGVRV
ncbi:hypothetical protein HMN09_01325500 [Mycena chlorophos]|uniref:Uncharacterized protein n=1 Tax=Mycena chlorophos TaxID=658473 RepID=A0A8H6RZ63_MYCCL|nr:hypothetical protein HMN09_01325500 [Mycena chlorophos]